MDPNLKNLIEGNQSFMRTFGRGWRPGYIETQKPHTAIFSCSDSRAPVEQIFNLHKGDIFVVREAGHVPSFNSIASLEFAISSLGIQQLIILGHTECGAIIGSLSNQDLGSESLNKLADYIRKNASKSDNIEDVIKNHSIQVLNNLKQESKIIYDAINSNKINAFCGLYNVQNGKVDFF